ncbi:MAG TPA: hypothetical protein VKM94_16685 [Blastocatellia bacterium]|nr:hypothetical protein [Blastocatellia bacterium]
MSGNLDQQSRQSIHHGIRHVLWLTLVSNLFLVVVATIHVEPLPATGAGEQLR